MHVFYPHATTANIGGKHGDDYVKDEFSRVSLESKIRPG